MKLIILWVAFLAFHDIGYGGNGGGGVTVTAQETSMVSGYNPDGLLKLKEHCKAEAGSSDKAVPVYIPKLNFAALDNPPDKASNWLSWFRSHAKRIINHDVNNNDRVLESMYDYSVVMLLPDTELLLFNEESSDEEEKEGRKEEYYQPDAFGGNKQQYDLETEDDFLAALHVKDAAINVPYLHHVIEDIQESLDMLGDAIDRQPTVTDFYISQPGAGSYGWHFDHDDGIIYLVEGNKHLRVAGTEVGSPTIIDVILQPGDAVYIPAKHYHYATGGDEQSVIWSIGFLNTDEGYTGLDEKESLDFNLLKKHTWEELAALRHSKNDGMGLLKAPDDF